MTVKGNKVPDAPNMAPTVTAAAIERRALILDRAAQLFDEAGYQRTTMTDIANSIGIRKPSLYHYYSTKGAILAAIHAGFIDQLIESQERRLEQGLTGEELVRDILLEVLILIRERRGHVRTFFEHHRELDDEHKASADLKRRKHRHLVQLSFERAIERGEFKKIDPELATHAVLGMVTWAYQWYGPDDPRKPGEVSDIFAQIVLRGLI